MISEGRSMKRKRNSLIIQYECDCGREDSCDDEKCKRRNLWRNAPKIDVSIGSFSLDDHETVYSRHLFHGTALIDTGATRSCINRHIAKTAGLVQISWSKVITITGGARFYPVYLCRLEVPLMKETVRNPRTWLDRATSENMERGDVFCFDSYWALVGMDLGRVADIILGRDFLAKRELKYDGKNARIEITC